MHNAYSSLFLNAKLHFFPESQLIFPKKSCNFAKIIKLHVNFVPTNKQLIGSGTGFSSNQPLSNLYRYSLTQQIYTAEELGEAGFINSIDFKSVSNADYTRNIDIYLVSTNKTTFRDSVDWISATAADIVFSGEVTFAAGSWTEIVLDNPFNYDALSNVAIIVDDNTGTDFSTRNFLTYETESYSSIYIHNDGTNYDSANPGSYSGSTTTYKNVIRILKTASNSPYLRPSNFVASEIGSANVKLSWTDDCTPAAQEWVIAYKAASDEAMVRRQMSRSPAAHSIRTAIGIPSACRST